MRGFRKFDQAVLLETIEVQLKGEPTRETRNRKPLDPNDLAEWELRAGNFRVLYDVDQDESLVTVKAIERKDHNKLFIRGKEWVL